LNRWASSTFQRKAKHSFPTLSDQLHSPPSTNIKSHTALRRPEQEAIRLRVIPSLCRPKAAPVQFIERQLFDENKAWWRASRSQGAGTIVPGLSKRHVPAVCPCWGKTDEACAEIWVAWTLSGIYRWTPRDDRIALVCGVCFCQFPPLCRLALSANLDC
jgi:hypothetical protein